MSSSLALKEDGASRFMENLNVYSILKSTHDKEKASSLLVDNTTLVRSYKISKDTQVGLQILKGMNLSCQGDPDTGSCRESAKASSRLSLSLTRRLCVRL